jgi:hypothetical protein
MTSEERFERIEALQLQFAEEQVKLAVAQLTLNKALQSLTESVSRYVDASNARMLQMEANFDALIRAITAEHTNGKTGGK